MSCSDPSNDQKDSSNNLKTAEAFIDAFYSFDSDSLGSLLNNADKSSQSILYYQGWAEGGNYEIKKRHNCFSSGDSFVICPITVKDDLIQALELDMFVTDTFHLKIVEGNILSIETSSNDPPLFHEARQWVRDNRPDLTDVPCDNMANTPGDCVRAVVQGFKEFVIAR